MTIHSDLIAKLEAATEGSRELDCLVAPFAGWKRVTPSMAKQAQISHQSHGAWIAPEDLTRGELVGDSLHGVTLHRDPPRFTRSLDAALTQVPDGWFWHVGVIARSKFTTTYWARLSDDEIFHKYCGEEEHGSTAPLALCVAFLKAREAAR